MFLRGCGRRWERSDMFLRGCDGRLAVCYIEDVMDDMGE